MGWRRRVLGALVLIGLALGRESFAGSHSDRQRTRQVITAELFGRRAGVATVETCTKDRANEPCGYRLYLTRDLGRTWRDVTPPQFDRGMSINDVFWLGRRRGWVNASEPCTLTARFARTVDGGRTWNSARGVVLPCHAGSGIAVDFVDRRRGFLDTWDPVGEGSVIERSRDGGRTWSKGTDVHAVGPLVFHDRRHGYIATQVFYRSQLFSSRNGGRSWNRHFVRRPPGTHARMIYDLPTFAAGRRVLPVTMREDGRKDVAFYSNPIGPGPWKPASVFRARLNAPGDYPPPIPTSVASASRWWVFYGRGNHVGVTHDAGRSWVTRDARLRGASSSISALGGRVAWATTYDDERDRSFLYVTHSGGRRWRLSRPWRRVVRTDRSK